MAEKDRYCHTHKAIITHTPSGEPIFPSCPRCIEQDTARKIKEGLEQQCDCGRCDISKTDPDYPIKAYCKTCRESVLAPYLEEA